MCGRRTAGSSGSAGASSPGTPHVPFRLITCHVTDERDASYIDDPAESKTANRAHDKSLHDYRHVLKCVRLAEAAGHNNVLIGGDFCLTAADWDALLKRAVAELGCKNYVCAATTHGCIVAHPSRLITASNFSMFVPASFPTIESGRPFAYLVRIVWQLESQLSQPATTHYYGGGASSPAPVQTSCNASRRRSNAILALCGAFHARGGPLH